MAIVPMLDKVLAPPPTKVTYPEPIGALARVMDVPETAVTVVLPDIAEPVTV